MKKQNTIPLHRNLGYLLSRTANRLDLAFQRSITEHGYPVTVHQWRILQKLHETDGLSQVELGRLLEKNGPNVTRILDVMEKNGLIKRKPDPQDRRKYLIFLTGKGRKMRENISPLSKTARERAFGTLSENDVKKFHAIINRIFHNLE